MNSTRINTDVFDPDNIDGSYTNQIKENETLQQDDSLKTQKRQGNSKKKPATKTSATKEKKQGRISSFFHDRRTRLFAGITLIFLGCYLTLATISYFSHGANDQSSATSLSISEMAASGVAVENAGGPLGASIGHNMFSYGFGVGSFVIIYYFFALGWKLLHRRRFNFLGMTLRCLIIMISASIVVGYATYGFRSWIYWGGVHGYEVCHYLFAVAGVAGPLVVSCILIGLIVSIYLNYIRLAIVKYRRIRIAHRLKVQAQKEARLAEQKLMEETFRSSDKEIEPAIEEPKEDNIDESDNMSFMAGEFDDLTDMPSDTDYTTDEKYNITDSDTLSETDNGEVNMTINVGEIEEAENIKTDVYDPTAELSRYHFPSVNLLTDIPIKANSVDQSEMEENKERITETLKNYSIPISHIEATVGPTVTLYEIIPAEGVRIAKIKRLEDDIALSLSALGIRIIAPIPGKGTIGIEVPNKEPQMVPVRSVLASKKFQECKMDLPIAMGATISRDIFIADLAKMPHVLVAGATGQGKSVGLNVIIASLLYKKHPSELKFVLIDPKMVEFSPYAKLERHYLAKLPDEEEAIITDPMKVVATLNSLCIEMDNRYNLLKDANVRTIKEYNAKFIQRRLNPEKGHRYLPYIVIVVDEFGDLIMMAGKEVETPIARIAQKARAVGMHMILATQRPSTNVITGIIKANFPGRIAFRVAQMVDSRTILDRPGANQLIGKGDMLFSYNGEVDRVQCAFISTDEVESIVNAIDEQMGYDEAYPLPDYQPESDGNNAGFGAVNDRDPLFEEAARFVVQSNTASTSSLQRRYSIGYNRAGKIMDQMEAAGIVGPALGAKPRAVLIDSLQLERLLENTI
ncbi:DNA translocase FtsK [Muribaculum sp.]|jgi:S-DNA-T family DNA segregation ATPase FtsK/SpoIIIE|uniref:FtsK/SpoIIIE family DNA translocase n=2 Tax=Muribaculum TaxID=1918540 RepID=UPI00257D40CD|nr:DNA translocase FtsK [Muribaculum sp.]